MATDLKFDVSALDRASATFAKLGRTVERFERKLDQLDGKRIEAEVKVKVDDAQLGKLDKGLGDSVIRLAALQKALGVIALPASVAAAAPQLASLAGAALSATGAVGLLPAAGAAAGATVAALALGTRGLGDALDAVASGDAQALTAALAKLSPAARDVVLAVRDIGPAWKQAQLGVQERLLAGVGAELRKLSGSYLPTVERGLGRVAGGINRAVTGLAEWARQSSTVQQVGRILDNAGLAAERFAPAVANIAAALTDVADVGAELLPDLAGGFTAATERFRDLVAEARADGSLRAWIQGGIDTLSTLWDVAGNVVSTVRALADAAGLAGLDALGGLERATRAIADALSSVEGQRAAATLFREISETFGALFAAAAPVAAVLGELALTVLPPLLQVLQLLAPVLVPAAAALLALKLAAAGLARVQALPQWLGTTQAQAYGASTALRQLRDEMRLQQALAQAAGQSVGGFGAALAVAQARTARWLQQAREASSEWHNLARATDAAGERLATAIPQAAERAGQALSSSIVGAADRVARGVEAAGRAVSSVLAGGLDAAAAGATRLGRGLESLGQAASNLVGRIGGTGIGDRVAAGYQRAAASVDRLGDALAAGYRRVASASDALGNGLAAAYRGASTAVDRLGDGLAAGYRRIGAATDALGNGLVAGYRRLASATDALGNGLAAGYRRAAAAVDSFGTGLAAAYRRATSATDALGNGLAAGYRRITTATDALGTGVAAAYQRITTATDALGNGLARLRDLPALVTSSLQTGLVSAATAAASATDRIAAAATSAATAVRNLPSVTDLAGAAIRRLGEAATTLPTTFSRIGSAVGTAADSIAGGLSRAMAAMGTFSNAAGTLGSSIGSGLLRAGGSLVSFLGGPWGVALAAAGVALSVFAGRQADAAQKTAEAKQALEQQRQTLDQVTGAITQATVQQKATELAQQGLITKAEALKVSTQDYTLAALGNADALKRVQAQLEQHVQSVIAASPAYRSSSLELQSMGLSLADLSAAAQGSPAALAKVDEAVRRASGGSLEAQTHLRMVADALIAAGGPAADLGRQLLESNGGLEQNVKFTQQAAAASGALAQQMQGVRTAFAAVPDQKTITVDATSISGVQDQLVAMGFQITNLPNGQVQITAPTDQALAQLFALKTTIDATTGTVIVDGNVDPATGKVQQTIQLANGAIGTITVDARPDPATGKIQGTVAMADGSTGTITIDGRPDPATGKINATVSYGNGQTARITVDANMGPAEQKLRTFLAQKPTITVGVKVDKIPGVVGGGSGGFVAGYSGGGAVGAPRRFAAGGVIGGYRPGVDDVPAMLSRGEAVLVPELVRQIGVANILRANAAASGGRPATVAGNVPPSLAKGAGVPVQTMIRGAAPSSGGGAAMAAAVGSLRGELVALRSQMAAVGDAVRSARPITVEDRSGNPVETAHATRLALRTA